MQCLHMWLLLLCLLSCTVSSLHFFLEFPHRNRYSSNLDMQKGPEFMDGRLLPQCAAGHANTSLRMLAISRSLELFPYLA